MGSFCAFRVEGGKADRQDAKDVKVWVGAVGSFCRIRLRWCVLVPRRGRAQRHGDTEARRREKAKRLEVPPAVVLLCFCDSVPLCCMMPSLRKTGGVMRFGEHFCAADFYKRGFCRGICGKIFSDSAAGAVGFLVTGAQRAAGESNYGR